mgnify:CR=1 FL=1
MKNAALAAFFLGSPIRSSHIFYQLKVETSLYTILSTSLLHRYYSTLGEFDFIYLTRILVVFGERN